MIRPLEDRDLELCRSWYNYYVMNTVISFEEAPVSAEAWKQRTEEITKRYPWIVLEEDGVLKGYAYLSPFHPRSAYRFTADVSIYLDPAQRGKGYGKPLMRELERLAKEQGIRNLISLVTEGNQASETFHEACGFVKKAVLENTGYKFGRWIGVTYYMKALGGTE